MESGVVPGLLIAAYYLSSGIAVGGMLLGVSLAVAMPARARLFGLYAALSAAAACFQVATAAYHTAPTMEAAVVNLKWVNFGAAVVLPLLFAFVAVYTRQSRAMLPALILAGLCAGLAIINFMMPYGIRFIAVSSSELATFPWGERLQILRGEPSLMSIPVRVLFLSVVVWGLLRARELYQQGERVSGAVVGAGFLGVTGAVVLSALVEEGRVNFVNVGGYGVVAFVVLGAVLVARDLRMVCTQLEHLALNDVLTGLPNRAGLMDRLQRTLSRGQHGDRLLAVLLVDLDRFDVINDTLGHAIGDRLLVEAARRLQAEMREGGFVARLSGDEFVVVATGLSLTDGAGLLAEKLLQALHLPYEIDDNALHVTVSIGVAVLPEDGSSAEALLTSADLAMRHAKRQGRGQTRFFHQDLNLAIQERLRLGNALRAALAQRQFALHFQPQVSAGDGRVVCVEALLRWHHPQQGLIPPDRFIPIAEEMYLIIPIGAWVLEEACRTLADWRCAGIADVRMAVNLSAQQLLQADLHTLVGSTLARHGLRGEDLELELTESAVMIDPEKSVAQLNKLREFGVKVAIDDFGTGYSSLSYLKLLPVDALKIDRSFVRDLSHDSNDAVICATTVSLATSLGICTVAEGVETEGQAAFLSHLGCELLQGFLYARPLPAESAAAFIRERNPGAAPDRLVADAASE